MDLFLNSLKLCEKSGVYATCPRPWDIGCQCRSFSQPLTPNPQVPPDSRDGEALHPVPQPRVQQLIRL